MILDLVLIGLTITLEPLPLTAFLLVLASERGARKGAAFVFGWFLSLAIVIALTVLATGNNPPGPRTAPSAAVLAVKIAIGAGLLLIALRQRRRMGRPKKPRKIPKWQARVDKMSSWYAVVIAALVQPWLLVAGAAAIVVEGAADVRRVGACSLGSYPSLSVTLSRGITLRPTEPSVPSTPDWRLAAAVWWQT